MRNDKGQFVKGTHWRARKPYWDKMWLEQEYLVKKRSASDIAKEEGCSENNVLYWLAKHEIECRTISEARKIKHWGSAGENNPMFGVCGENHPRWRGGISPERQGFYSSLDWGWAVKEVWKRDKARCQRCGKLYRHKGQTFHIHHRITFAVKDIRTNVDNLVLLCCNCHQWVHSKANLKQEFIGSFQPKMDLTKGGDDNGGTLLQR